MGIISKPNNFSASTTISSSAVNSDFDTIYNEFNGAISAANLATDSVTTAKIADSNVTTAKIADASVTNAKLASQAWQTWTPTWTNFTPGSATIVAKYTQVGKLVQFSLAVTLSSSSVTGAITFTLPATSVSYVTVSQPFGVCTILDTPGVYIEAKVVSLSTTTAKIVPSKSDGVYTNYIDTSSTVPMTWGNGDGFYIMGAYEAA